MGWLNNLKSRLIKAGKSDSINLLNSIKKLHPREFEEWKKTGSHIILYTVCNRYAHYSIYYDFDKLENDVEAIGNCWRPPIKENNESPY